MRAEPTSIVQHEERKKKQKLHHKITALFYKFFYTVADTRTFTAFFVCFPRLLGTMPTTNVSGGGGSSGGGDNDSAWTRHIVISFINIITRRNPINFLL